MTRYVYFSIIEKKLGSFESAELFNIKAPQVLTNVFYRPYSHGVFLTLD